MREQVLLYMNSHLKRKTLGDINSKQEMIWGVIIKIIVCRRALKVSGLMSLKYEAIIIIERFSIVVLEAVVDFGGSFRGNNCKLEYVCKLIEC